MAPMRDPGILEATHSPAFIRLPAPSATNEAIGLHFSSQFTLNAVARRREMRYSIPIDYLMWPLHEMF